MDDDGGSLDDATAGDEGIAGDDADGDSGSLGFATAGGEGIAGEDDDGGSLDDATAGGEGIAGDDADDDGSDVDDPKLFEGSICECHAFENIIASNMYLKKRQANEVQDTCYL